MKFPKKCRQRRPNGADTLFIILPGTPRRRKYFGRWDDSTAHDRYETAKAEFLLGIISPESKNCFTIAELVARFLDWAEFYYKKHGRSTGSYERFSGLIAPPLLQFYADTPVTKFDRKSLKLIQEGMIEKGLARSTINDRITLTKQIFRWGEGEDLVPPEVCARVCSLRNLKKDRSPAREPEPVGPVSDETIEKTVLWLSRVVADMVFVQRHSGMRPGELFQMRWRDIDRTRQDGIWLYYPGEWKTEHHRTRRRVIPLCGSIQTLLLDRYAAKQPDEYLFSPKDAVREHSAERAANRKTRRQPSQIERAKKQKRRADYVSDRYNAGSFRTAIHRAADRAGVPRWSPNQLRHTAATEIRAKCGLEAAQVILGHSSAKTTEIYAETAVSKAIAAVQEIW